MIDLYVGITGNAMRAAIALAESGLPHRVHKLNLMQGEQRGAAFLKINPAGRVPAIVDSAGPTHPNGKPLTLSQSGAILIYIANKSGSPQFWPKNDIGKIEALQWTLQACTDAAPLAGIIFQSNYFAPVKSPENIAFFENRLVNVLKEANAQLKGRDYLAGEISIADFALYPIVRFWAEMIEARGLKDLSAWAKRVGARPAVKAGVAACAP